MDGKKLLALSWGAAAVTIAAVLIVSGAKPAQTPSRTPEPKAVASEYHYTDVPIEARTIAMKAAVLVEQGDIQLAYAWGEKTAHDLGCKVGIALAPISARTEREVLQQLKPMVSDISDHLRTIQAEYVTDGPVTIMGEFQDDVMVPDKYAKRAHRFVLVVALACPR